ncbi:MAG: hypothetical protein KGS61_03845 [Verrucomicrobia bacterium]|nr:hypothetical protein [Verrucomicrobiota bacterium]
MNPEQKELIRDLFAADGIASGRAAVLAAGGRILRRRRIVRRVGRASLVLVTGLLAVIAVGRLSHHPKPLPAAVASSPASKIQVLTDDELLALFPNTPVALAKIGNKEKLIFPRPGDERRYITHIPAEPDRESALGN